MYHVQQSSISSFVVPTRQTSASLQIDMPKVPALASDIVKPQSKPLAILPPNLIPESILPSALVLEPSLHRTPRQTTQIITISPSWRRNHATVMAATLLVPIKVPQQDSVILLPFHPEKALAHPARDPLGPCLAGAISVPASAHNVPDVNLAVLAIPPARAKHEQQNGAEDGGQGNVELAASGGLGVVLLEGLVVEQDGGAAVLLVGVWAVELGREQEEGHVGGLLVVEHGGFDLPGVEAVPGRDGVCLVEGSLAHAAGGGVEPGALDGDAPSVGRGVCEGAVAVAEEVGIPRYCSNTKMGCQLCCLQ